MFFSVWPMGSCRWCSFFWIRQTCQWCASWRLCNFLSKIACLLPSHLFRVTPVRNWTFESNHETDAGRPQNDVPPTHKWDWTYLILKPMENSRVSSFQWSYTGFFRDQIIWNLFCEDQTSNKMMYQKPFWWILFLKMVSIVWIKCHFNRSHLYLTFWLANSICVFAHLEAKAKLLSTYRITGAAENGGNAKTSGPSPPPLKGLIDLLKL